MASVPVGRFRDDPRELDDDQRVVTARQYAEGLHVLGSLLGLALPYLVATAAPTAPALLRGPLGSVAGLVVGGVGGYLLGDRYARKTIERRRGAGSTAVADGDGTDRGDESA